MVGFESARTLTQIICNPKISNFSLLYSVPGSLSTLAFPRLTAFSILTGVWLSSTTQLSLYLRKLHISPESRNSFVWLLVLWRTMPRKDLEISWNINDTFPYSKVIIEKKLREMGREKEPELNSRQSAIILFCFTNDTFIFVTSSSNDCILASM